ncbi:MAG: sigma 54-interacting transcriptional regulator [Lachnospiraceae bacterium]|nr:sigma 54-interacting transcriptional regulator [Lachnospiraceae bacterium]
MTKGEYLQIVLPEGHLEAFVESGEKEQTVSVQIQKRSLVRRFVRIEDARGRYIGNICILSEVSEQQKSQMKREEKDRRKGFESKYTFKDLIGSSYRMKECIAGAKFFAGSDANVLIYGETGVGKEILAQSIHKNSRRAAGPFIGINCAALPENLLESELFGYDEGAFTGGRKGGKPGLFELAENGTLFLDEIGEINPSLQSRLLRVLQEKEVMHIGGDRVIPINARIISATNRNLEQMDSACFRRDLLYRLNILELQLPPLRERENDVIELFRFFCANGEDRGSMENGIGEVLKAYSWPGNVRELQNVCERYSLYMQSNLNKNSGYVKRCIVRAIGEERLFRDILRRYSYTPGEKEIPEAMLTELTEIFRYSKDQLAEKLGISRTTLWRKEKNKK